MRLQFRCVKVRKFDGERPKRNEAGGTIRDAKDAIVMEPVSLFTIEFAPLDGDARNRLVWGENPFVGKLELNRIEACEFEVGRDYSIEIGSP